MPHDYNASATYAEIASSSTLRRMVFWLALPAVGEQVLNTTVGLTDQFFVGHLDPAVAAQLGYDQPTALAAVGLGSLLAWIITTIFMAVAVGATTIVARRMGENQLEAASDVLRQALIVALVFGAMTAALTMQFSEWLLAALGASPVVITIGAEYLRIVAPSFIPTAFVFAGTAAFRGAGDTRSPLYVMVMVVAVNFALTWLLVNGAFGFPALGVKGSAIGSALARSAGGVLLVSWLLAGKMRLHVAIDWRPHWPVIRNILRIGLPAAGEYFVFQAAVILTARLITNFSTSAYAAHSLASTIESVSFLPGIGFGVAATTLVGQLLGAGDAVRAKRVAWEALRQGGLMMTVVGLVMAIWPTTIVSWLTPDPTVIAEAEGPLRVAGLTQPLLALSFILVGALRGAGDTTWPLWMRVISTWIVRVPLSLALLSLTDWGLVNIWIAMFADYLVQGVLILIRFHGGKWQTIEV
jgi:putative MATE family efflux protein